MAQEPEAVLKALEPMERGEMLDELRLLASRAATVRKGSELLALADDVIALAANRPALKKRFGVTVRRTGTQADIDVMFTETQVMERAAQIDNSVEDLGAAIEEELRKLAEHT